MITTHDENRTESRAIISSMKKHLPRKMLKNDAGYDLKAVSIRIEGELADKTKLPKRGVTKAYENSQLFEHIDYIEYDTGVKIEPDVGIFTTVFPRSSVSNKNLVLANSVGLIDNGYRGNILLRFKYIWQPEDAIFVDDRFYISLNPKKIYNVGDRIGQLVFMKEQNVRLQIGNLNPSDRGDGGLGSTGE